MAVNASTTEEVREAFACIEPTGGAKADDYETQGAVFDRWLETFKAEVRAEAFAEGARLLDIQAASENRSDRYREGYADGMQRAASQMQRLAANESYPTE